MSVENRTGLGGTVTWWTESVKDPRFTMTGKADYVIGLVHEQIHDATIITDTVISRDAAISKIDEAVKAKAAELGVDPPDDLHVAAMKD